MRHEKSFVVDILRRRLEKRQKCNEIMIKEIILSSFLMFYMRYQSNLPICRESKLLDSIVIMSDMTPKNCENVIDPRRKELNHQPLLSHAKTSGK